MNIKKLFPERKISKKGVAEFFDKKGFYIVLILCVAIVGVTAVFVTTGNLSSKNSDFDAQKIIPEDVEKNITSTGTEKETMQSSLNAPPAVAEQKTTAGKATDASKATAQSNDGKQALAKIEPKSSAAAPGTSTQKNTTAAKTQVFTIPVFGNVSFEYSQDKLVYSKTLEEWRSHSGVDIAADRGTPVKAVADGVVSEIKSDPRLGILVIIDHLNGIKTVYANLASDDVVSTNQKIKQGDVMGSIGNSATFESAEAPHLHFEVLKSNEPVDPALYLPKK